MTLSLNCACGARLEIDDAFAGKVITCPDCNKPINTAPPLPEPERTSGFALASFVLALAGAFTVLGTITAVLCGLIGLRQIRRHPEQIGGRSFAKAGVGLGIFFTLLTFVLLFTSEILPLDGLLRTIESAGMVDYPDPTMEVAIGGTGGFEAGQTRTIKLPSPKWGQFRSRDPNKKDDLILVDLWDDAYIVCLTKWEPGLTLENCREVGQEQFLQSDLVTKVLGRLPPGAAPPAAQDSRRKQLPGTETQEFLLDLRLAGADWTFLVRVIRDGNRLSIVAGGSRKSRFARLEPEFIRALDSFRQEKG